MADNTEDLNYDFNYNLFVAKNTLNHLTKPDDKTKATRWMKKLSRCNRSIAEMKMRNDFMYYLIVNIQSGTLQAPFDEHPPEKPLPSIAHLLPGAAEAGFTADTEGCIPGESAPPKKPLIYESSPDGGEFLAAQPIPRCGAFCYLAVIARTPEKDE